MSELLSWLTPGVMSTSRPASGPARGWRVARAMAVAPPSDIPTTAGPREPARRRPRPRRRPWREDRARPCRPASRSGRARAGRSATRGRSRASATVSQVWAFWPPPWRSTSSGGPVPQTRALTRRSGRHLDRLPAHGRVARSRSSPTSLAFSCEQRELVVGSVRSGRSRMPTVARGPAPARRPARRGVSSAIGSGV